MAGEPWRNRVEEDRNCGGAGQTAGELCEIIATGVVVVGKLEKN